MFSSYASLHISPILAGQAFVSVLLCLFSVFAFVKVTQVIMAVQGGGDVLQGVVAAWDLETQAMFSAVIAFWFGNRMMKSAKK